VLNRFFFKRESTSVAKLAKMNHVQVESCTPELHSGIIFGAKPILNVPKSKFPPKSFFTQIDEEMEMRRRKLEEKMIYDENKSLVDVLPNLNTDELMNEVCLINDDEVTTPFVCNGTSAGKVLGVINNKVKQVTSSFERLRCANKFNSPGLDQGLGCTDPECYFSERCCGITSQS